VLKADEISDGSIATEPTGRAALHVGTSMPNSEASLHSPIRQIRASFDDTSISVYQAYSVDIARAAVEAKTFVAPFKRNRMTWIKPSFLWMMYRSGWATKRGQERILRVQLSRRGFEAALRRSCLSHFEPAIHRNRDEWLLLKTNSEVRVQWDPERSLDLEPLPWRSIQIGLSGSAVDEYVSEWILDVTDVTEAAHDIRRLRDSGDRIGASSTLPAETPYILPPDLSSLIGASA
jgi:hypothetical protein